jgi:alkylhydroperoxidase family enzyme
MRLTPIERPGNLLLKIIFFLSKKQFGKVIAPLKYIYARSTPVLKASFKIVTTENKLSIGKGIRRMIRYYTSHLNDCPFCSNLNDFTIAKENIQLQEWKEFTNFRNSTRFSGKEKALLAYLEEINLTKTVTDESFENLQQHFSEKEIVEITWVNATENYFNLMAKPLGLTSDQLKFEVGK